MSRDRDGRQIRFCYVAGFLCNRDADGEIKREAAVTVEAVVERKYYQDDSMAILRAKKKFIPISDWEAFKRTETKGYAGFSFFTDKGEFEQEFLESDLPLFIGKKKEYKVYLEGKLQLFAYCALFRKQAVIAYADSAGELKLSFGVSASQFMIEHRGRYILNQVREFSGENLAMLEEEARIIGREVRESGIEVLDMSECRKLRSLAIYSVDAKVILPESVDNSCKVAIEIGSTVPDGFSKFVSNKNVNLTISASKAKLGNIGNADSLEFNCTSAKLSDVNGLPKKVSINCSDRILVTGCHDIEELTINLSDGGEARVYNCENLRRATIFGFKSLSVLELEGLFLNCPKLEEIELSCEEFSPSGSINRSELSFKRRLLTINGITGGNVKRFSLSAERCVKYAEYHYHEPVIYTLGDTKHIVSENIQQFFADYKASAELAELLRFSRLFSVLERDSGELFLAGTQLYIDSRVCVDMFNRLSRNSSLFSGDVFNIPKEIRYLEQFNCDGFYNIRRVSVRSVLALREKAFYSSKVEEIVGSEYIDEISRYSFSGSSLKSIVISDKIAGIPDYAFSGCGELRDVKFLGNTRVNTRAFLGCSALSDESLKEIWKRGAGKDSEFIFEVLFAGDWKSLADKTMPIMPEHLKYTYAIYRLVSIYGKESLASMMTNDRDDLFFRDLSVLWTRRRDVEADIRERFKTRGKVSEDTLVCERAARELFQDYGKFMQDAVEAREMIPTGHENKAEWERLSGYQQGRL